MSIYDLVMLIILIGAILFGLWKGLAWQVASVAAIFLSYFVSVTFRGQVATFISAEEPWNQFAAMLILFLGTSLIVWSIFAMVKGRIREMELNGFDRQAGALLGAVKGALLCMVVTMFAVTLLGDTARNAIYASRSGGYIVRGINQVSAVVPTEIHKYIDPYIAEFNNKIADPNGNLPYAEPIFGSQNSQQATSGTIWPAAGGSNSSSNGSVTAPSYRQPYGQPSRPSNNGLPTSGQYSSGSYTQNPNQVPTYTGQWQIQQRPQQPATNNSYPQNGYNGYQSNRGYGQAAQNSASQPTYQPQARPNSGFEVRPQPAAPQTQPEAQTANGWPDLNFRVNSKDLIDRAIDGTRRAIENSAQR
jgi:membrane protein required for colicin V production